MFNPARAFVDFLVGHTCPQAKTNCVTPQNVRVFADGFNILVNGDIFVGHSCGALDFHTPKATITSTTPRVLIGNRTVVLKGTLFSVDCFDSVDPAPTVPSPPSRVFIGL